MLHASRLPTEAIDDAERVLVAVHDASTRDTAVATLMAAGHVAVGAASERDAVVALESPVAVVIIDADVLGSAQLSSLVQAAQRRSPPPCWIALCPPTQHGGTIAVRSAPGAGATFTVTLPWFAGDAPERERTRTKTAQRGGEAVLVVEDEPLVRRSLVRSLERQGYRVTDVADGVEAISLITTQPTICDLVITDVRMPRMNGAALAAEIRAVAPALPILFISGHPDGNAGALLREHTAFVEKPVSPGALLQAVRDLLDTEP